MHSPGSRCHRTLMQACMQFFFRSPKTNQEECDPKYNTLWIALNASSWWCGCTYLLPSLSRSIHVLKRVRNRGLVVAYVHPYEASSLRGGKIKMHWRRVVQKKIPRISMKNETTYSQKSPSVVAFRFLFPSMPGMEELAHWICAVMLGR